MKWDVFLSLYLTQSDEGISGASAEKRPEFMKMIRHCKNGKIDLIITKSISRFARNTLDSIGYVRKLKAMGVGVLFEKENINTLEENSEVVLTILASLVQEELNSLSMNVKMGKRMAMKEGKVTFQYSRIYAYKKGEDGQPEIIPEEAIIIRRIYESYLSGDTTRGIADTLNAEGIPYRNNNKWKEPVIRSLLSNEKYCGDVILQKTFVTDPISKKCKVNNGELPKIYIKNNHVAIIGREIFDRVQAEKARRGGKRKVSKTTITESGKYSSLYALSEILICGHCGSPYRRVVWTKRSGEKQPVWRCINRLDYGTKYCSDSVSVDEESLHKAIMGAILSSYNTEKIVPFALTKNLRDAMRKQVDGTIDIGKLEQQVKVMIDKIMQIVEESGECKNEYEYAQAEKQMHSLSVEARRIQDIIDEYKANNDIESTIEEKLLEVRSYLESQPQDILEYNDSLVRQTIDTIKVMDTNHIIIYFKNGTVHEQLIELKVRKLKKQ
ncbi:recombinase family protein [Chakrabartyella piscis]|uniref:recombinase family protein n=1 Tax=Chakrabartyella piscis TaxID=2918914 RepID=UPI0029587B90|nr:recombinase family protein [Chakrabartyella piscis]